MKTDGYGHRLASKADLERWLNENPEFLGTSFKDMRKKGPRSQRPTSQYGRHLYLHHREEFNRLFKTWWTIHPELWNAPYVTATG